MISKTFNIYHTRLNSDTTIIESRRDIFNQMTLIIEFEYTPPTNYYLRDQDIVYGLYIDREFIKEFHEKMVKVQLESINAVSVVEIFVHPHSGFQYQRNELVPGNKIKIRFRAKDPNLRDISRHDIYWDNATGVYLAKRFGSVNAVTGEVQGLKIKSCEIL